MPLNFTDAHSSRISKSSRKKSAFDRKANASFARLARPPKSLATSTSKAASPDSRPEEPSAPKHDDEDPDEELFSEQLEDRGLLPCLPPQEPLADVVSTIRHIQDSMFDEVPLERSGMSSTRIAEVLNFRKRLPPLVTNAHVHAIVQSPTAAEREIAALVKKGIVRRINIPGRGTGGNSTGESIALVEDWMAAIKQRIPDASRDTPSSDGPQDGASLDGSVAGKYIDFLHSASTNTAPLLASLDEAEVTTLMRAGFVTASSAALRASTNVFTPTDRGAKAGAVSRTSYDSIARAASGSVEAVGGASAVLDSGGGGGSSGRFRRGEEDATGASRALGGSGASYDLRLTLPSTGPYLKLVVGAKQALMAMLEKAKYQEAPMYLLRERWDGTVGTRAAYGRSKDPFAQVLPGKIRKWKEFYGLRFDWVLAECLGTGMVEVFETGSVGLGVRTI